jgi:hypothetical protein
MAQRSSDNEGIRMLPEFVCEAIPAFPVQRPPTTNSKESDEKDPGPEHGGGESNDDDPGGQSESHSE